MELDAIRNLERDSQRQVTEWAYQHLLALSKSQARYLTLSLVAFAIGLAFLADRPPNVGYGDLSVSSGFFILWFSMPLPGVSWVRWLRQKTRGSDCWSFLT
jgi:hypothetical protein